MCVVLQCALREIGATDFKIQQNVRKWLCRRTSNKQSVLLWTHLCKIKLRKSPGCKKMTKHISR